MLSILVETVYLVYAVAGFGLSVLLFEHTADLG
jgi:hypothetical protein